MSQKALKIYFCFAAALCVFAQGAMPCFAVQEPIRLRNIHISQERFAKNGVLVSRPILSDQKIVDIVSQNKIQTIEDYAYWLEKNMTYQPDMDKDHWLAPEEFLKTRRGDCEDFAFLNSRFLKVFGFSPHIITLTSAQTAHAVCAFEYAGKFYWFDNARLKSSTATSLVAFAQQLTDTLNYSKIFELDPVSKQTNLIYERI